MVNKKSVKKHVNKKSKHTKRNPRVRKSKKQRSSRKKTKKLTKRNKKRKSKPKQTTLMNGGGCGCSTPGTSNSFRNYMSNLTNSLSINKLGGGGYSVMPDNTIKGFKTTIREYDDNNPPVLKN